MAIFNHKKHVKELSELAVKRRITQQVIADRKSEIALLQNEYGKSTSPRRKRALLQRIGELANRPLHEY